MISFNVRISLMSTGQNMKRNPGSESYDLIMPSHNEVISD